MNNINYLGLLSQEMNWGKFDEGLDGKSYFQNEFMLEERILER